MASCAWKPRQYSWRIAPAFEGAGELARHIGTSPLVAQILHNRGIADGTEGRAFLNPRLSDLHAPDLLGGCAEAARRIAAAVARKKRIIIYGDYDVDGITGVAILHAALRLVGSEAGYYVPHRLEEGYGVNAQAVAKLIAQGTEVLITVDCGISGNEPLAAARSAGLEVIVTDHHAPPQQLPPADVIVHPSLPPGQYPNPHLSGSGVALKLAWQIAKEVCGQGRVDEVMRNFLLEATCLAALGTIADVVPLVGENRCLAIYGLRGLPATRHPGLRALLESARLTGERLDAYHVGFLLAPRLNACGRMGHAQLAVELLTDVTPERAEEIAQYLTQQNVHRQKVEREITEQAVEMVRDGGLDRPDRRAIVLASDSWHGGVIGIVASRLVDRFHRPAILVAFNGDGGQGSCRSIPGFDICQALAACSEHLRSFGGHAMAGGLRIERENLERFTAAMLQYASLHVADGQLPPPLAIDAETTLASLSYNAVEHIARLAPFGQGNPPPILAFRRCRVLSPPRRMGRGGQTVSLVLSQGQGSLRAVGFSMGDLADALVGVNEIDVAAQPVLNCFNGQTSVELQLQDVRWG
jgi:single-stranded-DNA-specific exonuclease